MTFADRTSAQQLPQTSISHTAQSGGFADFRKQQQARLLAAIDSTLATQAEKAISDNFAAVKQVGVNLQTGLGGRKANIGINFIGAFAESERDAFGWQLRAYGGKDIDSGANAGVFYRNIGGGFLLGGNAFADYEKHKYGEFVRYSIGAEVKSDIVSFAANYYIPLTDNKSVNATLAAFSRQGYDGKLRIAAPRFRALKAAVDYYHFVGEGDTAKENGFRYGMEWHPTPALRLNLFYDDGGEKFGGDIAYAWTLGETQKRESNAAFSPDMFAAVSREYSQRIATVATTTAPPIRTVITPLLTMTTTMIARAAITTTTRMTAAAVTTTTTTEMPGMVVASRVASVEVTVGIGSGIVLTTFGRSRVLVTLPPVSTPRPHVLTITTIHPGGSLINQSRVIITPNSFLVPLGAPWNFPSFATNIYTITLVQGGEEIVGQPTTTTLTTRTTTTMPGAITETPMTMAAVSITTRITTFSTMFITLTANSAMGGNDERGGNDKQPSFPRKRESKPLSFVYLRDSANGDLSPQMANRRVRKARS